MGDVAYFASYNDYPAVIRNAPPDTVLEGCVNGSITQVKGTLLNKKDIKLGAIPGKEIEYTMPLPGNKVGMGRSRIFLDKTRLYQVLIVGEKDKVVSKSGDDFLKSFDVTKQISP